jgi:hypothetical protein
VSYSATGRSLVKRSRTDCGVEINVITKTSTSGGQDPRGMLSYEKIKVCINIAVADF